MTVKNLIEILQKVKEPQKAKVYFEITDERLERYLFHDVFQYEDGPPDVTFHIYKELINAPDRAITKTPSGQTRSRTYRQRRPVLHIHKRDHNPAVEGESTMGHNIDHSSIAKAETRSR